MHRRTTAHLGDGLRRSDFPCYPLQPNPPTRDASPEQNSIPDPKPQPDISQASDVASIKGDDLEHEPVAWASVALAEKMHGEAHHDEQQGN